MTITPSFLGNVYVSLQQTDGSWICVHTEQIVMVYTDKKGVVYLRLTVGSDVAVNGSLNDVMASISEAT